MDSSRRAVESYWRSRMIDAATSDEDKITPVYKLEEICELLRSSHVSIVKEVSEFILKRLEHKSPVVKQKALRLIKYAVSKSGVEFRRQMQRHSVTVRQLIHYKGQLDALKGDALNKAVRDTAQEAISAIFAAEENKPAPSEDLNRRIQGFGNTNYEMPSEDKKSFLSEVVGLGSTSIKQGLSSITQGHSLRKNDDSGSYKSPNLRRSLTTEVEYQDRYEGVEHQNQTQSSFGSSKNVSGGPWGQDARVTKTETTNGDSSSSFTENKTREERLLETIVTSGGVRLQPTRDALQVFLMEAAKLDALALSHALESKLHSPLWQVRMKAVCVLESILRKKDEEHFSTVESYFCENKDVVLKCSESPQASLREKANKVLSLLGGDQAVSMTLPGKPLKTETAPVVPMPDLIDTGGPDDYYGAEDPVKSPSNRSVPNLTTPNSPLIDDLFGDSLGINVNTSEQKNDDDDPFADVSFLSGEPREKVDDLFSGMTVDDKVGANEISKAVTSNGPELFDIFGSNTEFLQEQEAQKEEVHDLMAGLSINGNVSNTAPIGMPPGANSETIFSDSNSYSTKKVANDAFNGFGSQTAAMNTNTMFPLGSLPFNIPPGLMFNPAFPSQSVNYGAMGNFFAQQQLLAAMSNFQQLGNLTSQSAGMGHAGGTMEGGYSSPLPDIFNPNITTQNPAAVLTNSKKEDTKAFDFISDHLAAARDPKRVI